MSGVVTPSIETTAARLRDRVGEIAAARAFQSRWRLASSRARAPWSRFERVYLPVAISGSGAAARNLSSRSAASEGGERDRLFVVERVLGHGWMLALALESALDAQGESDAARSVRLPARLDLAGCAERLERIVMRARLVLRHTVTPSLSPVRHAAYPFWLRYHRDRGGQLRFDALDAVTGRRAGGPLRSAIAAALIDAAVQ